jgi:hypothetical protein
MKPKQPQRAREAENQRLNNISNLIYDKSQHATVGIFLFISIYRKIFYNDYL